MLLRQLEHADPRLCYDHLARWVSGVRDIQGGLLHHLVELDRASEYYVREGAFDHLVHILDLPVHHLLGELYQLLFSERAQTLKTVLDFNQEWQTELV